MISPLARTKIPGSTASLDHDACGVTGRAAPPRTWRDRFRLFSNCTSVAVGSPWTFVAACFVIVIWGATGPIFKFSDTWQLVINTGTTIVTFLMVFLIQNTQNRDAKALHLKLDELIRGLHGARNKLVDLENATDEELDALQQEFRKLRTAASKTEEDRTTTGTKKSDSVRSGN